MSAPRSLPGWLVRLAGPYGAAFLTTTLRASNEKAKRELGWAPAIPTYRVGIPRVIEALRCAAENGAAARGGRASEQMG